ncbi:MAG: exonuclease V, partial [Monoraphidium minutum]
MPGAQDEPEQEAACRKRKADGHPSDLGAAVAAAPPDGDDAAPCADVCAAAPPAPALPVHHWCPPRPGQAPAPANPTAGAGTAVTSAAVARAGAAGAGAAAAPSSEPAAFSAADLAAVCAASSRLAAFRPRGLYATDLTGAEWCQVQVAFGLQRPDTKRRSAAMRSGSFRHKELEDEMGIETTEVEVGSDEDYAAVKLINTAAGLAQLVSADALTRELFVFGWLGGGGGGGGAEG